MPTVQLAPIPKAARRIIRVVAAQADQTYCPFAVGRERAQDRRNGMISRMRRSELQGLHDIAHTLAGLAAGRLAQFTEAEKPGVSAAPSPAKRATPASAFPPCADAVPSPVVQEGHDDRHSRAD